MDAYLAKDLNQSHVPPISTPPSLTRYRYLALLSTAVTSPVNAGGRRYQKISSHCGMSRSCTEEDEEKSCRISYAEAIWTREERASLIRAWRLWVPELEHDRGRPLSVTPATSERTTSSSCRLATMFRSFHSSFFSSASPHMKNAMPEWA